MPTPDTTTPADRPAAILAAWAGTLVAALAATWRLWTPLRDAPRVAPLSLLGDVPPAVDYLLIALVGLGVCRALGASGWRRGVGVAAVALAALMAMDQLRWQPWAWHAVLAGVVLASADRRNAAASLRAVTIAVYAYSALAKLDAEFAATLGRQMLGVVGPTGERVPVGAALVLPVGELLLAGLLAASLRWRRLGAPACVVAAAMHAATIGVLGPWGLGHSLGVLVWNAGFAWQTVVLFRPQAAETIEAPNRRPWLATAAIALGVVAPALTPLGWWDQWPGWALYAPGAERATLFVHSAAADRLPASLRPFVDASKESVWRRVELGAWTLAQTGAPIYPQNRVVAAVATGLAEHYPLAGRLRLVVESAAGRVSRERESETLDDAEAIAAASGLGGLRPRVAWTR